MKPETQTTAPAERKPEKFRKSDGLLLARFYIAGKLKQYLEDRRSFDEIKLDPLGKIRSHELDGMIAELRSLAKMFRRSDRMEEFVQSRKATIADVWIAETFY